MYAGATIMGDGRVALILDVLGIGQGSGVFAAHHEQARASGSQKAQSEIEQQRMLLFQAGSFERLAVPLSLVARLEVFPQSAIEHAGAGQVVQYRDRILPLVSLRAVLESGGSDEWPQADPVQVVVFNDGDRSVGMVVDQILDVVEEAVTVRQKTGRKGLLGSAVIGKRVTDFLDLNEIIQVAAESWFQGVGGQAGGKRVLVAEGSAFSRCMIRSGLDMAGYRVLEAANLEDALGQPRQLLIRVLGRLDDLGEVARVLHVGGVDAKIIEGEVSHALGKQDGQRVRLLPHGRAGIPNAGVVSARNDGEAVFHGLLQHLLVAKKEREGQSDSPSASRCDAICPNAFSCSG